MGVVGRRMSILSVRRVSGRGQFSDSLTAGFMTDMSALRLSARSCPACESSSVRPASTVREYSFLRCRACGTCYCEAAVDPQHTRMLYRDETYFRNAAFTDSETGGYHGYQNYLDDRLHIIEKFSDSLRRIERIATPGRLLDIGSGPGLLLSVARDRGWRVLGLDLNPWASRYARDELGIDVRTQALEDADFGEREFDAVTMMDLLEHVPDPEKLISLTSPILRPGGALAVLTPDAGSLVSRLLGRRWPELQRAPEHLVLFSVKGLSRLLERHGFEVMGWHSVGKRSSLATLVGDVSPILPGLGRRATDLVGQSRLGQRKITFDPHTKFCLYARRRG